jgi:hypothetical protein
MYTRDQIINLAWTLDDYEDLQHIYALAVQYLETYQDREMSQVLEMLTMRITAMTAEGTP